MTVAPPMGILANPARTASEARAEASSSPRYYALDSLRASMMLLGVYLHVVVGYTGDGHWPYIDPHPAKGLSWTLGLIHAFRMPIFYIMAGFFGALLWHRRGVAAFAANRAKRVLLPLLLFWTLLFPIVVGTMIGLQQGPDRVIPTFTSGAIFHVHLHPMHLWFLEYLILLYLLAAAAVYLSRYLPEVVRSALTRGYRWGLQKSFAPVLAALFSWLPLTAMRGNLKDCEGVIPEPLILAAYVVPFGFGWLLYQSRDLLPRFQKHIWIYLALTVPAFLVYGLVPSRTHPFLKAAGNVTLCWLWAFACIGLFLKYCDRPSPRWRYMSDASYWVFIMHLPVVVGFQGALAPVPMPALAKIPIVLALSLAVLIATYDVFVRPTWIGVLLNGRRYPRNLPTVEKQMMVTAAQR